MAVWAAPVAALMAASLAPCGLVTAGEGQPARQNPDEPAAEQRNAMHVEAVQCNLRTLMRSISATVFFGFCER